MRKYDLLAMGYDLSFQAGTFFQGNKAKRGLSDFLDGRDIVLDVGCGTGTASLCLAQKARKVIGLDNSRGMLDLARKRAKARRVSNLDFIEGDAFRLPFEPASFDFVCTTFLFCELSPERVESIFSEMLRVLKVGGRIGVVDEANSKGNLVHSIHLFSHKLLGQSIPAPHDLSSLFSRHRIDLIGKGDYCFNFLTSIVGRKKRQSFSGR